MQVSNPANLPASAISIAAWVKIPLYRPSGAMVIVAKCGGGYTDSFVLYQNTSFGSPVAVFSFELVGGCSFGSVSGPLIPEDGQWHHVAGTWVSGSPASVYLDGVRTASSPIAYSGVIRYDPSFPISIGADFDPAPGLGWYGHIDDVRIYSHALSDAEVQELVRGNQTPTATDDFYGMSQASSLSVPIPGVLANDSDPDEDTLTVELVTGPANAISFQLNPDGSFSYTAPPYFCGEDTFTYTACDGTAYSELASVHITVSLPESWGFITGGGKFLQDDRKCTFGFVAKVENGGALGQLEFQDHGASIDVKSMTMQEVYAANQTEGYFSGSCRINGLDGYTFFVLVNDRGQPGSNDDFAIWVFDSFDSVFYTADAVLAGGNIVIHGD
ncbi:MAG TPA: post-COAP-1 domain-containing protein [Candidatus Paceibacterota bacterium]|nr:post-COAP-1 domain-containing protein [Candidatus Paceibacterota bacterium]